MVVVSLVTDSPKGLVEHFFSNNAQSYDKVVNMTTFGRDTYWKEKIIKGITGCESLLDLASVLCEKLKTDCLDHA
ncbi:MAG: hypothetical protein KGH99_02715 [Thaumarchaeota archaeon]|nr:hypothetical protein [Nitrososphaerota archaeon]